MEKSPFVVRILLIEDNPVDQMLIKEYLKNNQAASFCVDVEQSISEGINRLLCGGIDLVILDLMLPDCKGMETYESLRLQSPEIPVIILTGTSDREMALSAMQNGAEDYLIKGEIDGLILERAILYALERSHNKSEVKIREENFRQIITRSAMGCIITDEIGKMLFVNPAAEAIFESYSFKMVETEFPFSINCVKDAQIEIDTPTGKKYAQMRVVKTEWEGKPANLVSLFDLTERIKAEQRVVHLNRILKASRKIVKLVIQEKDRHTLLKKACQILTRTRGYSSAWIVLFNENSKPFIAAESGMNGKFSGALRCMETPDFLDFVKGVFAARNVIRVDRGMLKATREKFDVVSDLFENSQGMFAMIRYNSKKFGLVGVSIPEFISADDEEMLLFEEMGADVEYALKNIDSEARLKLLGAAIDQSADSVVITGPQGQIQYVNPAFRKITGYELHEVVNQNPSLLRSGEQKSEYFDKLWKNIKAGKVWKGNFINKKKDGSTYHEEATIFPMIDDMGKISHFTKISRDVTEKIMLENQLRQSQKMEAVGRLAGGIAHDFNNLLTGIMGNSELLEMNLPRDFQSREYVKEIQQISQRASQLTRQLLTFSKRQDVTPEVMDLNEGVKNLEKMISRLISEDIELVTRLNDKVPPILIGRSQLDQIILNLAINSRDAMPGGGKLVIETDTSQPGKSTLLLNPSLNMTNYTILKITDNGTGIEKDVLSHIFEPFFTTKGRDKGTGLGLSTVYGIVEQAGGQITVNSEPGRGTSFRIFFPPVLTKAASKSNRRIPHISGLLGGNENLLIVEDEDIICKLIKKSLGKLGYNINIASKGEDALHLYSGLRSKPVLLLTDVILPDMNGIELASVLQKSNPDLKVIFMSGYAEDVISRYGTIYDELNFIEKPFGMSVLLNKIRQVLDK